MSIFRQKVIQLASTIICGILVATTIVSCDPNAAFQDQVSIPKGEWKSDYQPTFRLNIPEDNKKYALLLVIRHDESYSFSNIWLNVNIRKIGDKDFRTFRVEVPLADPRGNWAGKSFGGIWEQHLVLADIKSLPELTKKGNYEIKLEQLMRENPLNAVLNVGIRLEPVN